MGRDELARQVAADLAVSEMAVRRFLDALFADAVAECKAGRRAVWPNFGAFGQKHRASRIYRTPRARKRDARPGETADKFRQVSLPGVSIGFAAARRLREPVRAGYYNLAESADYEWSGWGVIRRVAPVAGISGVEAAEMFASARKKMTLELVRGVSPVYMDGLGTLFRETRPGRRFEVPDGKGGRKNVFVGSRSLVRFRVSVEAVLTSEAA